MSPKIESKALWLAAIMSLLMAIAGWVGYYYSNAQALLLDGNFSFIAFFATLIALRISKIKANTSPTYPFGQFVYESLFSFIIGLLTIGVIIVALVENISKIFEYLNGETLEALDTKVILIYTILMVLICFYMAWYFKKSFKASNQSSPILNAYNIQFRADGFLSAGVGIALFGIGFLSFESTFAFMRYIGDAIVVILVALTLVKPPILLIRESFVELSGGAIRNQETKAQIDQIVKEHLQPELIQNLFISKTGSSYLVVADVPSSVLNDISQDQYEQAKSLITSDLKKIFPFVFFEILFTKEVD